MTEIVVEIMKWFNFGKYWVRPCGKNGQVPDPCTNDWRGLGW